MPILTEDHEALRNKVREFAEQEIAPVAAELDDKELFSVDLSNKMGELGLFYRLSEIAFVASSTR